MITKHCGSWLLYNKKTGDARRYFCGLVCCDRPECSKYFWLRRVHLINDLADEYELDKFFTLTMSREMPLVDCWKNVASVWNKFLTVIRRIYPSFVYVAVLESHNPYHDGDGCDDGQETFLGYPHIHGVTSTWIATEEYSRHFSACGGGEIAWTERVSGNIGDYLSGMLGKYFGKQNLVQAKRAMGKRKRTIWRSKGLKTRKERQGKSEDWAILKEKCFDIEGNPLYDIEKIGNEFAVIIKEKTF